MPQVEERNGEPEEGSPEGNWAVSVCSSGWHAYLLEKIGFNGAVLERKAGGRQSRFLVFAMHGSEIQLQKLAESR